jgi:TRAP-type C4-dicarboxylate transport system permease small subunit
MRTALDRLYDAAAWLAAAFLVGTLLAVVAGIADRYLNLNWRGTDMYAGYCMAAAGFLALAHTLKKGEHIRVTLVLQAVGPRMRRVLEVLSLALAAVLAIAFAWYSAKLSWQSYDYHDISTGNDATPLWIPEIAMAVGTAILAIAFVDEFVLELLGRRVVVTSDEALHNE